jgi:hypothetical protein
MEPPRRSGPAVIVDIPVGASAGVIGERLKSAGVIRSPQVFVLEARVLGYSGDM